VEAWRQTWGSGMWCAFLPGSGNGTAPLPSPRAAVAQMAGRQVRVERAREGTQ